MSANRLQKIQNVLELQTTDGSTEYQFVNWATGGSDQRAEAAANAEHLKAVLERFVYKIYSHEAGVFWYIERNGRIACGVPWGSKAHGHYSVKQNHANILRHSLRLISETSPSRALFKLNVKGDNRWYLNGERYPLREDALNWVDNDFKMDAPFFMKMKQRWDEFLRAK